MGERVPHDDPTADADDLVFDGERFVPGAGVGIAYEHWSRYALAAGLVEGRDVLEVASGEGYGTAFLARTARSVRAFDASVETVEHARRAYGDAGHLQFEQATIGSFFASAAPASFDVVVAFEVIEHVPVEEQEALLDGIKRVLRPGGSALVSTPDKLLYTDRPLAKNPFHVREFYREEFLSELIRRFAQVRVYDQALLTGCAILAPQARILDAHQMSWLDLVRAKGVCQPGVRVSGEYIVALVSDGPLPELPSLLLADFSRKLIAECLQAERRTTDRLARELEQARRAWEGAMSESQRVRGELTTLSGELEAARAEAGAAQAEKGAAERARDQAAGEARRACEGAMSESQRARGELTTLSGELEAARAEAGEAQAEKGAAERARDQAAGEARRALAALADRDAAMVQIRKELALAKSGLRSARAESRRWIWPRARDLASVLKVVPRKDWSRPPRVAKKIRALLRKRAAIRALEASGLFDQAYYLASNADIASSGIDPVEHFLVQGAAEGRNPNPFFDTSFYLAQNTHVARSGMNPLLHYMEHGWRERRDPHPSFETGFYLDANPDVARSGMNPLAHFLAHGLEEGRAPGRGQRQPGPASDAAGAARAEAVRAWREAMERVPRRALVVDAVLPMPDRDSGSITALELMRSLQCLGFAVTIAPFDLMRSEPYASALEDAGFWCITDREVASMHELLSNHGALFDVVVPCRIPVACHLAEMLDTHAPDAAVVFETMDLHFLREEREATLSGAPEALAQARATRKQELAFIRRADATIVHSSLEREVLARENPDAAVFEMPYVIEARAVRGDHPGRRDVVFLGGFRHRPNVDAVLSFVSEVWPLVRRQLRDARFVVVGSDPPSEVRDLAAPDVVVRGYVEDLGPVFDAARLSVAPLRYGAGYKGKVAMSMAHGVPGVLSSVAAEGMGLAHEREVLIADGPTAFAEQVVRLHDDAALWSRLAACGLQTVRERFSPAAARLAMEKILRAAGAPHWAADGRHTLPPPRPGRPQPGRAVFPSRYMRDLHALAGVRVADSVLIPHGVEFRHAPGAARADRTVTVTPGRLRLLFAGRITHFKGLHTAIEALPLVLPLLPGTDVELAIVGDATDRPYVQRVERMVAERGLRSCVRLLPAVGEDALFDLFQQHDVYLFPSLFEPFALTLILALEAGIPTVASAAGGNVDLVIDHETGLLFPPGEAAALAECVAELACNPALRAALAEAGRASASRLTVEAMVSRLEDYLVGGADGVSRAGLGTS